MLSFIKPMLPTLADRAPDGYAWLHEIKYDGYRTQIVIKDGEVCAFTRSGHDWSGRYATIVDAAKALDCRSAILDGEMCVQNSIGVTDYAALLKALQGAPHRLVFFAFDLLHLDGEDLCRQPLLERRLRLEDLLGPVDPRSRIHFSPHHIGNGPQMFHVADQAGCEGIVSKRITSRYVSGRAQGWLKTKSFTVADYAVLGVERSSTGIPIALLSTLGDKAYVGNAMIALAADERDEFWAAVERLGTRSRLAGFGKRRAATWLKGGLVARVRHLRGEAMLRHATLQTLNVAEPLPGGIESGRASEE